MTAQSVQTDAAWRSRPLLSAGVRLLAYGTPIVVATLVVRTFAPVLTHGLSRAPAVLVAMSLAIAVSLLVSRLSMRLLPLVVLLRMTMLFPDRAPSRLKVARRATSMREITRLLGSKDLTEHEAAETMLALVTALGRHDRRTRGHSERVRLFCDLLSRQLELSAADAGRLRWSALIHDIGKLEVAAVVLNKPGSLNDAEWRQIKRHPEAGAALAAPLASWLGPWFNGIAEHHERYDGSGYPRGLAAANISMAGRAVAVVDAFETMTAARSYKAVGSTFSARAELTHCAGTHFDPVMVRAFLRIALPRLLWSVGPLAFLVNVPFLRWLGQGTTRVADVAAATTATASGAAGLTAVAVVVGALPAGAAAASPTHRPPASVKVLTPTADQGTAKSAVTSGTGAGGRVRRTGTSGSRRPVASGVPVPDSGGSNVTGSGEPSGGSGGTGASGSGSGGSSGTTVGSVGATVGATVDKTVDTVTKTVSTVGSTAGDTVGGLTGVVTGSSGSGSLGGTLHDTICTLPLGLCPH
ncbi:MAG: HD-GYP domain-containing protein [Actinomycetales bacterium]